MLNTQIQTIDYSGLRMRKELTFDNGLTAKGTETKRHKLKSKEPYSNLEPKTIPDQAYWMRDALAGDQNAYQSLRRHLAGMIEAHAPNGSIEPEKYADVYLQKAMRDIPDKESARLLGVKPDMYRRRQKQMIDSSKFYTWCLRWWTMGVGL